MSPSGDRLLSSLQAAADDRVPDTQVELWRVRTRARHFAAEINLAPGRAFRNIRLQYDPGWRWQRHDALRRYCSDRGVIDANAITLDFLLHHEVGHRSGCPGSAAVGDQLHEIVWAVLTPYGKGALTAYTVNLLADILVNLDTVEQGFSSPIGNVIEWFDQGVVSTSMWRKIVSVFGRQPHSYPDYFAIHVMCHLLLVAGPGDEALLEPFMPVGQAPRDAAERLATIFGDRAANRRPEDWPRMFAEGAAIIAPFLPNVPPPSASWPSRPDPQLAPRSPEEAKRRGATQYYDAELELPVDTTLDSGQIRELDWYYRQQTRALPLPVPPATKHQATQALLTLTPSPGMLATSLEVGKFDSLLLAVDVSGSMLIADLSSLKLEGAGSLPGGTHQWTIGSPYDRALRALYRVAKWAEGSDEVESMNVVTFSSRTVATGWFPPSQFSFRVPDFVFRPPAGGTSLDASVLSGQIAQQSGILLLIITDGQLHDSSALLQLLKRERRKCLGVLLVVGVSASNVEAFRGVGVVVHDELQLDDLPDVIASEIAARFRACTIV